MRLEVRYAELLDDIFPEVELGNLTFMPSRIIKELDQPAFREGMNNRADAENIEIV